MDMMIVVSVVALAIVMIVAYNGLKSKQPSDSILRQRAVFNADEQMTFSRIKEMLPEANVFAHVSFDALLTTKFPRTRRKYSSMFADFVVLDRECRVIAIVALGEPATTKSNDSIIQQDSLLETAGYKLIRYAQVPTFQQLREDFLLEIIEIKKQSNLPDTELKGLDVYTPKHLGKSKIYS